VINKPLVLSRLALIADYLVQMQRISKLSKQEFLMQKDTVAAAESYLRRTLEAVFDIGRHIAAKKGGTDLAAEYKGIAKFLADKNIVSRELAGSLVQMAGYRNRLVHLYHLINDEELYEILSNDLSDISRFISDIKRYTYAEE